MDTSVSVKRELRLGALNQIADVSVSLSPRYFVPLGLVVVAGRRDANVFAGF